jgi:hypothetical protein
MQMIQPPASRAPIRPTGADRSRALATIFRDTINAQDEYLPTDAGFASAINKAIAKANARGGGAVVIPNLGTNYSLEAKVTLLPNVLLEGVGMPTLRLASGVNNTVIEGQNFASLVGTSSTAGVSAFGLRGLIVDGNVAQNGSPAAGAGHGVAFVGRDFILEDLTIQNVRRVGLWNEYAMGGSGNSPYAGRIQNLRVDGAGEHGWVHAVSDAHVSGVKIREASQTTPGVSDAIWLRTSIRLCNVNIWSSIGLGRYTRRGIFVDADGCAIDNADVETAGETLMYIDATDSRITNMHLYNAVTPATRALVVAGPRNNIQGKISRGAVGLATVVPVVIGDGGGTTLQNKIDVIISDFDGAIIDVTNSNGTNEINLFGECRTLTPVVGTPQISDRLVARMGGPQPFTREGGRADNTIAIGRNNNVSVSGGVAVGQSLTVAAQTGVALGDNNQVDQLRGMALGGRARSRNYGERAWAAGRNASDGDAQEVSYTFLGSTTTATATELFLGGAASNRAVLPSFGTLHYVARIVGRQTNGAKRLARVVEGAASRGNGGAASADGTQTVRNISTAAGWDAVVGVDANGAVTVTVTGAAAENVVWHVVLTGSLVVGTA